MLLAFFHILFYNTSVTFAIDLFFLFIILAFLSDSLLTVTQITTKQHAIFSEFFFAFVGFLLNFAQIPNEMKSVNHDIKMKTSNRKCKFVCASDL